MYIYNVTTNIEESVHDEWVKWMKETHISDVLATGKFLNAKMSRVLVEEEMGGITYSVQFTTIDKDTLSQYYKEDAARLRQDVQKRFAGKFVSFRTEMEVVSEHRNEKGSATQYLFTYGTLQDETIQMAHFSRTLEGAQDILRGHKISEIKIANAYPTITHTENEEDTVAGICYVLTPDELLAADFYEGQEYIRKQVRLASGKKAWVYLGTTKNSQEK